MTMGDRQDRPPRVWRLLRGQEVLGALEFDAPEMFWTDCRFRPTPAFEAVRALFEAELAAGGELRTDEEIAAWERAWDVIDALALTLDPQDGSPPLRSGEFLLHIWPDGTARLRF